MKVSITPRAFADMEEIEAYIAARNPAAAARVRDAFLDAFTTIAEHPRIAKALEEGVRRFVLPRYPYLIFYTVEAAQVQILSVRHAARRPEGEA